MEYEINITEDAWQDLQYFKVYEQRIIADAIELYLSQNAEVESEYRKKLRPNSLAPWELKTGKYRAFYETEEVHVVKIVTIGHKEHNELYIRGKKAKL